MGAIFNKVRLKIYSEKKFLSKYILAQRFAVSNPPSKYFYIPEFWQAYGLEILPGGEWGGGGRRLKGWVKPTYGALAVKGCLFSHLFQFKML